MYQKINRNTLAAFKRFRSRMFHLSAPLVRNPSAALAEQQGRLFFGPQWLVEKGTTYRRLKEAQA